MNGEYLATDTETGGLFEDKNPILTCYMVVIGDDFGIIDELDMAIKPEAPFEEVTQEALNVNKIDMAKHMERPDLLTRTQANEKIKAFLKKNKPKGVKLKPLGHNLGFDKRMIQAQLLDSSEWNSLLHYSEMDTKMAGDLLKKAGWLPPEIGSLDSLVRHFNITQLGAHNARNDTLMTVEVYRRLVEMLNSKKDSGSESTLDILSLLEK